MTKPQAWRHRPPRWAIRAAFVALTLAFLVASPLAGVPARLIDGCAKWIGLAGGLELLSVLGFVVVFKLVFGVEMTWRQASPAGLRALGASTVLPAGGLVGPSAGAMSATSDRASVSRLGRATVAFVILTNAPGVIMAAAVGTMLWLGWPSGPHDASLTLLPALLALAIGVAARLTRRSAPGTSASVTRPRRGWLSNLGTPVRVLRDGVADARDVVTAGNWKLLGAFAYYVFDNAVLWAAFRAYGHTPPLSVVAMGYLIGSLGAALPVPGGIGAAEGGLIGALVLYGTPVASAVAAVLLYRSVSLALPSTLGALAWGWGPLTALVKTVGHGPGKRRRRASKPRPAADVAVHLMHDRDIRQQLHGSLHVSGGPTAASAHRAHPETLTHTSRAIPHA